MRRRDLIAGLCATAWPLAARAQARMPIIGYLNSETLETSRPYFEAFHRGLAETGYVEGRNVAIEYRWAGGQLDRVPALAADLVSRQVSVIATNNTPTSLAARAATQTIPTVFLVGSDPVLIGLVASLNRPSGNLTGVSILNTEVIAKRLELLHELAPSAKTIAFLANPTNPVFAGAETNALQLAAQVLGVRLLVLDAKTPSEIEAAFASLAQQSVGALVVSGDIFFVTERDEVLALAAQHAVPTIYVYREVAVAGGLMSYGTDLADGYRQEGVYTGRILKGDKPGDLPVQQLTKIELVLNRKTARSLGLTFPETLLLRSTEVIE
jgi:putative tryptophan/tyrosine transport system substrate-binding protein